MTDSRFPKLGCPPEPRVVATTEQLAAADAALGFPLPPSYRAFALEYGYGLFCNMFTIYLPGMKPGCQELVEQSRSLAKDLRWGVEQGYFKYYPDGSPELVLRLVPFGSSENGDILAWDCQAPSHDAEFWIYLIRARMSGVHRAAPDLFAFVQKALEPRIGGMVGRTGQQLPATFRPYKIEV